MPEVAHDPAAYDSLLRCEHLTPCSDIAPERRLMVALMRDAMRCIDKYRHARDAAGRRLFEQDAQWVLSDDRTWVYGFLRVCEALDLDAASVRRSLALSSDQMSFVRPRRAKITTTHAQNRRPSC